MDPNEKREEMVNKEIINTVNDQKCCVDCKTRKTPLWRSGPAGPKSLCNACGIRYRKKNRDQKEDLNRDEEIKEKLKDEKLESSSSSERRIKKIKLKDEKLESSSSERRIKKIKLKDEKLESGSNERRIKKNKLKDEKLDSSSKRRRLKVSEDLRRRVMALGEEVVLLQRRQRSSAKRQKKRRKSGGGGHQNSWKKMGEVEQAAVLLMAMSCDCFCLMD